MKNIKKIYAVWVYVKDIERSKKFYESIGLKSKFKQGGWIEFDLGETSFALLEKGKKTDPKVKPQKTRIMFQVDNIEQMKNILESNKVKIIEFSNLKIRRLPYGKLLTFEDPDGHWLELFEAKK